MQRGQIYQSHGAWFLRYREIHLVNGERVAKRMCARLAPISEAYPTKRSVLLVAEKILAPLNSGRLQPESAQSVKDFIEKVYLPHVQRALQPSTYKGYKKDIFDLHLRDRLDDIRLRDFRTVHAQRLLRSIPNVGHRTLLHIKSFLSGAFKHAKREGILDGENPMRDVSVPGRPAHWKGAIYDLGEIETMLGILSEPARIVVATAAFTGLRLSELRGLRWEDFEGDTIHVSRSVWRTKVVPTKTPESEATVPVLPFLKRALKKHRNGAADSSYIFAGEQRGTPLNLANLASRIIKPAIEAKGVSWKGWHSFRRGLASNLYSLGIQPKVIQAILRHSDIGTTLAYYIATPDEESRAALEKLEKEIFPFG